VGPHKLLIQNTSFTVVKKYNILLYDVI